MYTCITGSPAGYQGCYEDVKTARDLEKNVMQNGVKIDVCITECADRGYLYAGLQVIIILTSVHAYCMYLEM